jgi:hypothetical protein
MTSSIDPRRLPGKARDSAAWWTVQTPPALLSFLEHLRCLPLNAWAEAAGRLGPHATRASLRREVDRSPELARRARRRIDDFLSAAEGLMSEPQLHAMRKTALTAVLALDARDRLSPADFGELYAPFAELIPLETLVEDTGWQESA